MELVLCDVFPLSAIIKMFPFLSEGGLSLYTSCRWGNVLNQFVLRHGQHKVDFRGLILLDGDSLYCNLWTVETTWDLEVSVIFSWVLVKVAGPHMCVGGGMTVFAHRGFGVSAVHNYICFGWFGYNNGNSKIFIYIIIPLWGNLTKSLVVRFRYPLTTLVSEMKCTFLIWLSLLAEATRQCI